MIDLTEENRIQVPTAGFDDAAYVFPSFSDLAADIVRLQKRKLLFTGSDVKDRTNEERQAFFDKHCIRTENLPARQGEDLVELSETEGWKAKVQAAAKIAAVSVFDEPESEIVAAEAFGDPVTVEVDALVGKVSFSFPAFDNPAMTEALKILMSDRIRRRGRRIQDRSFDVRQAFFSAACTGTNTGDLANVPANWMVAVARAFERAETLSDDDLGN